MKCAKKLDHFQKFITPAYDYIERRSIYQNVQLFIMRNTDILSVAIFKYSSHKFPETILHTPKIPINLSIALNYCTPVKVMNVIDIGISPRFDDIRYVEE